MQKLDTPVQTFWCHWPICTCFGKSCRSANVLRLPISILANIVSIVYILPHKVNWLVNQFHISLCNFRQVIFKFVKSFLGIMPQKNRIGKPRYIPCPIFYWLIKSKIYTLCRFNILRRVRIWICHTTSWCITNLQRLFCIFAKLFYRHSMCTQRIVCNLENLCRF